MAIVGVLANSVTGGGINTEGTASLTHNFGPSSVWGHSSLQAVIMNDDDGGATTFVSKFVDATGVNNVSFIGIFASNCTSITYSVKGNDCIARALCITEFFG